MPLDLAILDDLKNPTQMVSILEEEHHKILNIIDKMNLKILKRLNDYYNDAILNEVEMDQVINEINVLINEINDEQIITNILIPFKNLCCMAKQEKKAIFALSD